MPSHTIEQLDRVLFPIKLRTFAEAAQRYYDWLDEAGSNRGIGEGFTPTREIEREMALAAREATLAKAAIDKMAHRAESRLVPRHLEREVNRIAEVLGGQVARWGWGDLMGADGEERIAAKLEEHRERHFIPFLRACLAWRSMPNLEQHKRADHYADEAERLGLEPLDLSGIADPSERVFELRRAWNVQPALGPAFPVATDDEERELGGAIDVVRRATSVRPETPTDPIGEAVTTQGSQAVEAEPLPGPATNPRKRRGGRPADTDPKRDARIAQAWSTGEYGTYAGLEHAFKLKPGDAERAIDRHRKRENPDG